MRAFWSVVLLAAVLCACPQRGRCGPGVGECPAGQVCDEPTGVCVRAPCADVRCAADEECRVDVAVPGSCVYRFGSLTLTSPDGGTWGPGLVPVEAHLDPWPGFTASGFPPALALSVTPSGLAAPSVLQHQAGGVYAGSLMITPSTPSRVWEVTVDVAGHLTRKSSFSTDTTPPLLTLALEPHSGAWRRDERPSAALLTDQPLDAGSVTVSVGGTPIAVPAPLADCQAIPQCQAPLCTCLRLDLSLPALDGLDAGWLAVAEATDAYGNRGSASSALEVTRVRWQLGGLGELFAGVALGTNGDVYVGSLSAGNTGRLHSVTPGGHLQWSVDAGSVVGIAVTREAGRDVVYAATNGAGTGAQLMAILPQSDGGFGRSPIYAPSPSSATTSALGLMAVPIRDAGVLVGAIGVVSSAGDDNAKPVFYYSDGSIVTSAAEVANLSSPVIGALIINPVIDGTTAFIEGRGSSLHALTLTTTAGWQDQGSVSPIAGVPGCVAPGLALAAVGGQRSLLMGGSPGCLATHQLVAGAPFSASTFRDFAPVDGGLAVGAPAVHDAAHLYFVAAQSVGSWVGSLSLATGASAAGPVAAGATAHAPTLGQGGLGYLLDTQSWLTVFSTAALSTSPAWTARLPGNGFASAPALDCLRDGGVGFASRLGVLYAASTDGTLTAVLVDSPKLDPTAEWPKYQRTAGNAGNPDDVAFPLNPGCP